MSQSMTSGFGQYHTNEPDPESPGKRLRPYVTIDLDGIRDLVDHPQQVDKSQAQWLIPSTLPSRSFKTQEKDGEFWMLWADLDKEPKPIDQVQETIEWEMLDECNFEIYSSRSATPEIPKARILVPLSKPLCGADWLLAQEVFNDKLEAAGLLPDRKSEGAAQLCYLPNRGCYYEARHQRHSANFNPMKQWSAEIVAKRTALIAKAAELEALKKASRERREALRLSDAPDTIGAFNLAYSVQEILLHAGYDQRGDTFRHPASESGSFSASVKNDRVHSLSSSDPLNTGGSGGGAHDAFSAFAVLMHDGNHSAALKDAGDNWLSLSGESWNKVKQREYMQAKSRAEVLHDFTEIDPETGEVIQRSGWQFPAAINSDEWLTARATPDCIVENYLFADVGVFIAPGGTGKTTLILYEAIHIALGLDLWGLQIKKPGPVLIITAEDTREMLVARLRAIATGLGLLVEQIEIVRANVRISDLSGGGSKLTTVVGDVVQPNHLVEEVIHESRSNPPVLVVIDPAVSFGVGESRVNDAEQGLIEAARKIRRELNCCVRYVHHTGKTNGREKTMDQYSGRGGSAFADGARMVTVMQGGYSPSEWAKLTGHQLGFEENALIMARPKLSYAPPQDDIFIVRDGYTFSRIIPLAKDNAADLEAIANQVWQLLAEELKSRRYHSKNTLDALGKTVNLKRVEIRDAVKFLTAAGRIEERDKPDRAPTDKGGAFKYLHPVELAIAGGSGSPKLVGEASTERPLCLAA